ncbi:AraC family transcriptional regulator [Nocardia goodfellowii]|uniref:AraC-like DNA-binding protein n=1 Tax=Nocardia goodfellowii TaxID=882446 RepID=A0ABS4QF97_9NOCA|nr:AraC family transcriptional regulator ligand-binding domain-containing protein [Nocardia goodfellowii]MBP2190386.1 AraC-like DNA-binding protein [Nocardia goodfellowii]
MTGERRRSVANVAILADVAHLHGLTASDCLRGTGIPPEAIRTPGAEIDAARELAVIRNVVTRLGDPPGLGLEAGLRSPATAHGAFGLAMVSSPTVRAALDIAVRYHRLSSYMHYWHTYRGTEVVVCLDDSDVPEDLRGFLVEWEISAILMNWMIALGTPPQILRIELSGGLRARLGPLLSDQFEIPVVDGAGPHTAVIDATDFDQPMPFANPMTAILVEEQCAELLERRGLRQGFAGSVREVLMRRINGRVTQEEVAAVLNLSLRTMRRRLAEEGTSYRRLCVETYGSLAEDLLSTGLTVEDVAYRMGYAGAPSFSNAFKQWRGISPGRFARDAVSARSHAAWR